ncbi:hypothetical protein AVEN_150948-1 [Araneus ventricosus]|uniref:Uncharacterized protein n=1 Tax=Araneus ventricosus TaxID=182803 RepID=A0A4Y2Q1N9_ARAVE|nr:hypothetical protein AVEN_150948-1 [Araneus ventricosus]
MPLRQLNHRLNGHGTPKFDRTPPHDPVPDAITATQPVEWTWNSSENTLMYICSDRFLLSICSFIRIALVRTVRVNRSFTVLESKNLYLKRQCLCVYVRCPDESIALTA